MAILAVIAAFVLLDAYGTVLPSAPFSSVALQGPTLVDSNGEITIVADTESRRVLILDSENELTGVISCTTIDSPIDAVTDISTLNGQVYLAGVRYAPDSDIIQQERVAVYDIGGNLLEIVFEREGNREVTPSIKSLNSTSAGLIIAYETWSYWDNGAAYDKGDRNDIDTSNLNPIDNTMTFALVSSEEVHEVYSYSGNRTSVYDAAAAYGDDFYFIALNGIGEINTNGLSETSAAFTGHFFTLIDVDAHGVVYACDDATGELCAVSPGELEARTLIACERIDDVHENNNVLSVCNTESNRVTICDLSGTVIRDFQAIDMSLRASLRLLVVWISGLYLIALALITAIHKLAKKLKAGETEGIGGMFMAIAVVASIAIAITTLSYASYQSSVDARAAEVNMCADYLVNRSSDLSEVMERIDDRDAIRNIDENSYSVLFDILSAAGPAITLVDAANSNGIGMYCTLYGIDEQGVFYLYGSVPEYVMGTTACGPGGDVLNAAFEEGLSYERELLTGRTLRDSTQFRLVQIPTSDGEGVAGVIEIGSKVRSFESSLASSQAQRILGLLVLVLVVYLAYAELRANVRCLLSYGQRKQKNAVEAVALLTRPFTFCITLLASIDSVMTVLIARDLLTAAGADGISPLLALPAVMLGIGMIIGQNLYGLSCSHVELRKLAIGGAIAMFFCACITGTVVSAGRFDLYCIAKLVMSIPFGMLYALGFSLPRLARDSETRELAAGGVKRTDTSAAALGTVLGGYTAQVLGNGWVYALVGIACLPVILMALNLLPHDLRLPKDTASPHLGNERYLVFAQSPVVLFITFLILLPATVAAGYASFLFPLFSVDLGLSKSDINNIVVLGQLVVFVCITLIERAEVTYGRWRVSTIAVMLLGVVFLLFSINTTLVWSTTVIALVGVLCKSAESWKRLWLETSIEADVPAGRATGAMLAHRSLALIAQPFILGALLGVADSVAVIVIGVLCLTCAFLFFIVTRTSSLAE